MDREAARKALQSAKATGFFTEMYGDGAAENEKRYEHVLEGFEKSFGGDQVSLFHFRRTYRDQRKPHRPQ